MAHKDIQILFTIDGRNYEAVGFLNEGEERISSDHMFARTANKNGGAIGTSDEQLLLDHQNKIPIELQDFSLIMNRRCIDDTLDNVSYIEFECRGKFWGRSRSSSRYGYVQLTRGYLVLRRLL